MQGHIRKRGKTYQYMFYINEGEKRKCISKMGFPDKKSAEKALRDVLAKYDTYKFLENDSITFKEIAEEYIEYYAKENLKINTYMRYKSFYNKYLKSQLGNIKITSINGRMINKILKDSKYMDPNKPLNGTTLQGLYILINAIFNRAIKQELIIKNPCKSADRPKREHVNYSILTYDEIKTILSLLDTNKHFDLLFASGFLITIESGLRRGELAGLTWDNINLDNNTLTVLNTMLYVHGHTVIQETPKSDSSIREIYYSDYIKDIFLRLKSISNNNRTILENEYKDFIYNNKNYNFVFRHENGQHIHPMWFYNKLQKLMKASGINKHIRWHDLRHSSASLQLMSGADITTVSKRIGHYDPAFTLKIYSHVDMTHQKKVVETFSSNLLKIKF